MKKFFLVLGLLSAANVCVGKTVIESQAVENGVVKCESAIKSTADFIIKDKAHATHSTWNSNDADNRLYASLTSKGYSDGDSHVTVIAAPTLSGKCDTTYVESFAMQKTCMVVREEVFKSWKYVGTMKKKTLILKNEGGSVNIYLSSQGAGENLCLVTRREVIYN